MLKSKSLPIGFDLPKRMGNVIKFSTEHGADDYLSKPLRQTELVSEPGNCLPLSDLVAGSRSRAAGEATTAQAPIWDATILGRLVGENDALRRRLLAKFLLQAQAQVTELGSLAAAEECDRAADIAHTLKSAARAVGALLLGELCQAFETAGHSGDAVQCRLFKPAVTAAFEAAKQLIRQHLEGAEIRPEFSTIPNDTVSP